jgi:molybdopterin molybdotransferase
VTAADEHITLNRAVRRGQNVRAQGEDLLASEVAVRGGTRIHAGTLALLASLDVTDLSVLRRPRVAIVCTGDELRPPGDSAIPGSIPDALTGPLTALLAAEGAELVASHRVPDQATALQAVLGESLSRSDIVLTVGGASVGTYDVVGVVLKRLGAETLFDGVNLKPGRPVKLARRGVSWVLALPGNPVSALVCFQVFGVALLRALVGQSREFEHASLGRAHHCPSRAEVLLATVSKARVVTPLPNQSSGSTVSLARCDGFALLPARAETYHEGERVAWIPWPGCGLEPDGWAGEPPE